ncbi:MAG: hypothetical protein ABIJ84_03890 [bacterium]
MRAVKKDKYFRDRGNVFKILQLSCARCGKKILLYQKDGRGILHRLYLNRILAPENLACLQENVESASELERLICECGNIIGIPMQHWEGRVAFRLINGTFKKQQQKKRGKK